MLAPVLLADSAHVLDRELEGILLSASERLGIQLSDGAGTALITGNDFVGNPTAIAVSRTDAHIEGNTIKGGASGVVILRGRTPAVTGNTIEGAANFGIRVQGGAGPTLADNRICDNGRNLVVDEGAEPVMQDDDFCPDLMTSSDD